MEGLEICPVRHTEALSVPELREMEDFCCCHPCMQISALHCRVGVCERQTFWEEGAYNQLETCTSFHSKIVEA